MYSQDRLTLPNSRQVHSKEQRKHIRIEHNGTVHLGGQNRRFSGRAVNISRNGMQVVVNLPDSYESVRSITFNLPNTERAIKLPCRIVRCESDSESVQSDVLGLEFSFQGEAQLLLIENYIREIKHEELAQAPHYAEMRQIPRADCSIPDISVDKAGVRVLSIDNISTGGLLITFKGDLQPADLIELGFRLPHISRMLRLHGRVAYVIKNPFNNSCTAGVYLESLRETDRARIQNFVVSAVSSSAMRNMHSRYSSGELDQNYRIRDRSRITNLLRELQQQNLHLNLLFEESLEIVEVYTGKIDVENGRFITDIPTGLFCSAKPVPPISAYMSFYLNGGSHYYKCRLIEMKDHGLVFEYPEIIYQSEKRSYQRKIMEIGTDVDVILDQRNTPHVKLSGRLIDISRRGFLCEVAPASGQPLKLKKGQSLAYSMEEALGLDTRGVIRHLTHVTAEDGSEKILIGVEAGIQRQELRLRYFSEDEWSGRLHSFPEEHDIQIRGLESMPVRYRNDKGREIAALINATGEHTRAPVVILPPAFGKKKETLSPLVATLVTNFQLNHKQIVCLRYDGINRPGESHNDESNPKRGYEMLRYRLGQGQEDLRATLDFVYDNPYFTAERVILVTFSMSALDARKLLSSGEHRRVHSWISCMGVPAAQSAYGNILGGMDILGNYKLKIRNGIGGVLGHLLDLDALAKDLITQKSAYITDSRLDMTKIPIPVLWIYGTYDKWLVSDEIKDIMSVKAAGEREVIEIPTGHNLRCSEDALNTFRLIAAHLFKQLHGEQLVPVNPDKEQMLQIISYERERVVMGKRAFDPVEYWKEYLIGQDNNSSGYDFYSNFAEFKKFLDLQVDLIEMKRGDRIADLGCGTGLFLQSLLERLGGARSERSGEIEIVAIDIVQEALDRAREKYKNLLARYPELEAVQVQFRKLNLEPNRLIPIYDFIRAQHPDYEYLRNRVEGLRNVTIDFLNTNNSQLLSQIMRGKPVTESTLDSLGANFLDGHRGAILDFNRAARFLLRRLQPSDLDPNRPDRSLDFNRAETYDKLTTRDLKFEQLSFSRCDLDLSAGFTPGAFTKVVASLFISYLFDPGQALKQFYEMLVPGGKILVSSMRPDSDISPMYTRFIENLMHGSADTSGYTQRDQDLQAARAMLNEAASLFTLEEEGYFKFYSGDELVKLLKAAGFKRIRVQSTMGWPPQAVVATGKKPL